MKLSKRNMRSVSFMLFSMFFGAGNLIFPPFMGQSAGTRVIPATVGFLITGVVLPILAVVVVSRYDGLDKLGRFVGKRFAIFYTILVYLSIGPGVAIPRTASVPFEMAVAPYLPEGSNLTLWLFVYSAVFFAVSALLCMRPNKIVDWLGVVLTPALLALMGLLFIGFLTQGQADFAPAQESYQSPFLKGFTEGYQTLDVMAGLNFGLVVATTLRSLDVTEEKDLSRYTWRSGLWAGLLLAAVYVMLAYMGAAGSGVYELGENGAVVLRNVAKDIFGEFGAILMAAIFTLACLTTCVGLTTSISQYFSSLTKKIIPYRGWVLIISAVSLLLSNMGLSLILSISVPILNAIYPIGILLILLGLSGKFWEGHPYVYPLTAVGAGVVSVVYALFTAGVEIPWITAGFRCLPLFDEGFAWLWPSMILLLIGYLIKPKKAA